MKRVALITLTSRAVTTNPGCDMITDGIRYLLRQVLGDATTFVEVEILCDDPNGWTAAATCDMAVLCGNPRFSVSQPCWWERDIWSRLMQLEAASVRVLDGWAGACMPLLPLRGVDEMARVLYDHVAADPYVRLARAISWRVTRDAVAGAVYRLMGAAAVPLPCSSWWAARNRGIGATNVRDVDVIALLALPGHDWLPAAIRAQRERMQASGRPCLLVASNWDDWVWARGAGFIDVLLIRDVESLLRLYTRCARVLAFRIHAAIPAASLGAEVGVVSIDTRAQACEPFGLPCIEFTELLARAPDFALAQAPDDAAVIAALEEMLCS